MSAPWHQEFLADLRRSTGELQSSTAERAAAADSDKGMAELAARLAPHLEPLLRPKPDLPANHINIQQAMADHEQAMAACRAALQSAERLARTDLAQAKRASLSLLSSSEYVAAAVTFLSGLGLGVLLTL